MPTPSCQAAWAENYVVLHVGYAIASYSAHDTYRTRIVQPYAYSTYHTCMRMVQNFIPYAYTVRTIRMWYVPYAYGTIYTYGIEQYYLVTGNHHIKHRTIF